MKATYNINVEELVTALQNRRHNVVIFGAGLAGEAVLEVLRSRHIPVACFCDNNLNKTGTYLHGVPIYSTIEISKLVERPFFVISAADIGDVVQQLRSLGFQHWSPCSNLLRDFNPRQCLINGPPDFIEYVISSACVCQEGFLNPRQLFLRSVDLVITERCSLRCKDCANLMQYYAAPKEFPLNAIFKNIEALFWVADRINEVRVIGGEPLMNSDFHLIAKTLIGQAKCRQVIIYTNGTICPKEEHLRFLADPKVLFFITDYGRLSRNLNRLTDLLEKCRIRHFVQQAQGWSKCGTIGYHHRSLEELYNLFTSCCSKNVTTLLDGFLYRCPFSANATNLSAVPVSPEDRIRIFPPSNDQSHEDLKEHVSLFIKRNRPLLACAYCEGRPFGAPLIKPAIQAPTPLTIGPIVRYGPSEYKESGEICA